MKKTLLLCAVLLCLIGSSSGQSLLFTHRQPAQNEPVYLAPGESPTAGNGSPSGKATTGNASRWYSYFETVDSFLANGALRANLSSIPIWQDSTVRQRFTTGYAAINYSSVYQVMGPAYFLPFNNLSFYPGALYLRPADSFSVDSIFIAAVYQRLPDKAAVVDTLILSVTHLDSTANFGTLPLLTVASVDSLRRTAATGAGSSNPGAVWKVPLYYADSAINGKFYRFRVGGPASAALKVPAGRCVAITATFKTGDTWVRNVDSFNMHNNWRPITGTTGSNAQMPYYWYTYRDRDMSGLLFSTDSAHYYPSLYLEGVNTTAFAYEFHYMGLKASCSSCKNLAVPGQSPLVAGLPYPNPAGRQLRVPYRMAEESELSLEVRDLSGRLLLQFRLGRRPAGAGEVAVTTEALPSGSYLYLLRAGSGRAAGQFSVQR